jgi:hypothetical protein|tara:strand:+ start:505 stop:909 length:405 start_codon:yes stop_codon:yes gene_type:complete
MASKSATKTKPALWKRIVASVKAGTAGGRKGQWSARKAQIATARYKKAGGGYRGKKSSKNSLTKWSKQKWDYVSKGDAKKPRKKRGRYLPESVRKSLSASQKAATNRRKRAASAKGKQRAKYTKRIASRVRRAK